MSVWFTKHEWFHVLVGFREGIITKNEINNNIYNLSLKKHMFTILTFFFVFIAGRANKISMNTVGWPILLIHYKPFRFRFLSLFIAGSAKMFQSSKSLLNDPTACNKLSPFKTRWLQFRLSFFIVVWADITWLH